MSFKALKIKKILNISAAFLVCIFLVILFSKNVYAADPVGCAYSESGFAPKTLNFDESKSINAVTCCSEADKIVGRKNAHCFLVDASGNRIQGTEVNNSVAKIGKQAVTDLLLNPLGIVFRELLFAILTFFGWLLGVAGIIFAWVVDPSVMSGDAGLFNKVAVRDIWVMVRDFLNLFFILVLLFSAFSTIFQVGTYHISKVWLKVLLNALLVNFSFPIARLVIDLSNVIMYYFLNNMFSGVASKSGASIFANIANYSSLASVVKPENYASADMTYLIASIVFVFILALTLLVIAALFVVRLVVLTMLIMFSPIGFVGNIFPSTKTYAKQWWDSLFQYAFFGPIMTFGIAVSLKIMETLKNDNLGQVIAQAKNNAIDQQQGAWMGEVAFFTIPIIILWTTMGYAQEAKIAGASAVTGRAEKFANWMKSNLGGLRPAAGFVYKGAGGQGINQAVQKKWDNFKKTGPLFGTDRVEERTAKVAQALGVKGAVHDNINKRANEYAKDAGLDNLSVNTLQGMLKGANEPKRVAILEELAKKGAIDKTDLKSVIDKYGDSSQIGSRFLNKVKESRPDLAFNHLNLDDKVKDPKTGLTKYEQKLQDYVKSDKFDIKKINADALKDDKLVAAMAGSGIMDDKKVKDLTNRGSDFEKNYGKTLGIVMNTMDSTGKFVHADTTKDQNKNLQLQSMALTGSLHPSISGPTKVSERAEVFKKLDKNSAKNLKNSEFGSPDLVKEIAENLRKGKEGNILEEMKDEELRDKIIADLKLKRGPGNDYYNNMFESDPFLKRYK